ncbi:MAG: AzlD domain-containing protein [Cocleimonas sp.]
MSDWMLILSMALLTFLPRYLPFALAGKVKIPSVVSEALVFVPIAVLTVIVVQSAFIRDGELALNLQNHHMLASIIAFIVAVISRHMFLTIVMGLVSFALLEWLF